MNNQIVRQFLISPAAGKRIIAKSFLHMPEISDALVNDTIVIIAGTTNGYVSEEILESIGQGAGFSRKRFFRGIMPPPEYSISGSGRLPDESQFPGDVVIVKGKWLKGKTIFDVVDSLQKGDIIIKGANALDLRNRQAAIYIGHPKAGTTGAALQAVFGRRVALYLPVGLEKRVCGDINKIAEILASSNVSGPRLLPVSGNIITELDAIRILTGSESTLVAAGGVCGAEGSCWVAVSGTQEQIQKAQILLESVSKEPNFEL